MKTTKKIYLQPRVRSIKMENLMAGLTVSDNTGAGPRAHEMSTTSDDDMNDSDWDL